MNIEELKALSPSEENPIKILQHGYTDLGHTYYAIAIGSDYIILRESYPTGRATVIGHSWLQNYSFPKIMIKKSVTKWCNIYKSGAFGTHNTKEEADRWHDEGRVACIEKTFEYEIEEE
jgi:hypothetical protein